MSIQADQFRNKAFMAAGLAGLCLSGMAAVGTVGYAAAVLIGGPVGIGAATGLCGVGLWKLGKPFRRQLKAAVQNGRFAAKASTDDFNGGKPSFVNGLLKTAGWTALIGMAVASAVPTAMILPGVLGPIAAVAASSAIVGALGGPALNGILEVGRAVRPASIEKSGAAQQSVSEKPFSRLKQHLKELWHDSSYDTTDKDNGPVRYSYDELKARQELKRAGIKVPPKPMHHEHKQPHEEGHVYPALEKRLNKGR